MSNIVSITTASVHRTRKKAAPTWTEATYLPPGPVPVFEGTREEWAILVIQRLFVTLLPLGITWPPTHDRREVRVALTQMGATTLGNCHPASKSTDGRTNNINLSTDQGEPLELVHTLLHELLHAFDNCMSGHRGRWKRWADQIGIQRAGHTRGPIAERLVQDALRSVGTPAAHVQTVVTRRNSNSQVRFSCSECSGYVHMPAKLAEGGFEIGCVKCNRVMTRPAAH